MGKAVELSVDLIFKVKDNDKKLQYEWSVGADEIEDDEPYKLNKSGVLSIQEFEKELEGIYQCKISTASEPILSVSAEVQLQLTGSNYYSNSSL